MRERSEFIVEHHHAQQVCGVRSDGGDGVHISTCVHADSDDEGEAVIVKGWQNLNANWLL